MSTRRVAILSLQCVSMKKDYDETRKAQGARLKTLRMAARYTSARAAALDAGWPESTYRAHENGTRTIDPEDAARYVKHFLRAGAKHTDDTTFSGKWIIYGDGDDLTGMDFDDLVRNESAAFRQAAFQAVLDLKKRGK